MHYIMDNGQYISLSACGAIPVSACGAIHKLKIFVQTNIVRETDPYRYIIDIQNATGTFLLSALKKVFELKEFKTKVRDAWAYGIFVAYYATGNAISLQYACTERPLKNRRKKMLMTNGSLMKVENIEECST